MDVGVRERVVNGEPVEETEKISWLQIFLVLRKLSNLSLGFKDFYLEKGTEVRAQVLPKMGV